VLPELFGAPTGEKKPGERMGRKRCRFVPGPPSVDGVVWPDGRRNRHEDQPHGPCRRGEAEPPSVAGVVWGADRRKKPGGEDGAEALPICSRAPKHQRSCLARRETEPPRRPTAWPMPVGGKRSPQVLPELFGAPTGEKNRGRGRSGRAADFLLGPQALMELVGLPGGKIKGSTGRSRALPICCGPPSVDGIAWNYRRKNFRGKPDRA